MYRNYQKKIGKVGLPIMATASVSTLRVLERQRQLA